MILTLDGFTEEEKRAFLISEKEREQAQKYLDTKTKCRSCKKISVPEKGALCFTCYKNHAELCGAI